MKENSNLWIARLNIAKMEVPPKVIFRFSVMPIRIPSVFLAQIEKFDL